MSFAITVILFTIIMGIGGSLLADRFSVYALVPVTFLILALAAAAVSYGANFYTVAIAALCGWAGLQCCYFARLFNQRTGRRPSDKSSEAKRREARPQNPFEGRDGTPRRSVPRGGHSQIHELGVSLRGPFKPEASTPDNL